MAEIWGAVIAGGAALAGAVYSSNQAKKAGSAAAAGSDAAIAEQRRQFDLTRSDTAPYRQIGAGALSLLGAPYGLLTGPTNGFGPGGEAMAGATPVNGFAPVASTAPGGKYNIGGQLTQKLGTVGKILDPAAAIFGSKHGDENRNLQAFAAESGVMQLPDGRLALPDGTIFNQDQLQDVAGTWYGAKHAPDGDQAGWQQKFDTLTQGLKTANGSAGGATLDAQQNGSGQWVTTPESGYRPTPNGGIQQQMTTGPSTAATNPLAPGASPDYSNFFASPDFQFRQQEGDKAITRNAAALGGLASGNTGAALTDYSSNLAAGEYGNYFNRLSSLAGIGQSAVNTSTQAGLTTASNIGNAAQNGADARASGVAAGANAWGNALGTIGGIGYNYFNQRPAANSGYIAPVQITQRRVG
jgi:hypothetical protein